MLDKYCSRKLKDTETIENIIENEYRTLQLHGWLRMAKMKKSDRHDMEIVDAAIKELLEKLTEKV